MGQLEKFHFDFGDRRVRRDYEKGRVALWQEVDRGLGIVAEGRADARRVDQRHALLQHRRGVGGFDQSDTQPVLRVGALGDKTREELGQRLGTGRRAPSETFAGQGNRSSALPLSNCTRAESCSPPCKNVGIEVNGTTEAGNTGAPSSALTSVLLPRLNWPITAK